ncbi:hypothetical protein Tco_0128065 [Tanacetum coccineum]
MDNLNITMEEYIRLQEEKSLRHGRTFNWQTTTYGKVKYCEDEDDCFTIFETEFPAIVFDDTITSDTTLSCEPIVSTLNENEIDFRISFDESDDEDYADSENDDDKVDMPLFPSPEPTVSYFDDLDYSKDFEKEFPAIAYNDALTSKLDSLTKPAVNMALPQRDQRHTYFRFEGLEYTDADIYTFKERLERIFRRQIHRVQVLAFAGLIEELGEDVDNRLRMVHSDEQGHEIFVSDAWRRLLDIRGPLVQEDFLTTVSSYVEIRDPVRRLCHRLIAHNIAGRGLAHEKARDQTEIYLDELDRLYIYEELADTWAWVALGPERQQAAAIGAPEGVEGAHAINEGV